MLLFKEFTFDSAHFLPHVPEGHKCREMHGHTYRLKVWVEDALHPQLQWVMDFADLEGLAWQLVTDPEHAAYLHARLDARYKHILIITDAGVETSDYEAIIRQIMYLHSNGNSLRAIVRRLEAINAPAKKGGKWSAQTVSRVIKRQKDPELIPGNADASFSPAQ